MALFSSQQKRFPRNSVLQEPRSLWPYENWKFAKNKTWTCKETVWGFQEILKKFSAFNILACQVVNIKLFLMALRTFLAANGWIFFTVVLEVEQPSGSIDFTKLWDFVKFLCQSCHDTLRQIYSLASHSFPSYHIHDLKVSNSNIVWSLRGLSLLQISDFPLSPHPRWKDSVI